MAALGHGLKDFFLVVGQSFLFGFRPGLFFDGCSRKHTLEFGSRLAALGAVRFVNDNGVSPHWQVSYFLGHEREFLQGGDNDRHARTEGLSQLGRVDIDLLDHSLLVLELVDRILKLLVQNHPVSDHDDRVEDLLVLLVIETGQPMSQPGDGVGLAAAGRVLDEVVGPGPCLRALATSFRTQSSWW